LAGYQLFWLCKLCRGDCCRIYDPTRLPKGKSIGEWSDEFHQFREGYGVLPLFIPEIVHHRTNAHLLEILREKGIDPFACEYLGPEGCLIAWDNRPGQCIAYRCPTFKDYDKDAS